MQHNQGGLGGNSVHEYVWIFYIHCEKNENTH